LTIAVPGTASLGSGSRGTTVSASLGTVTITDTRSGNVGWTATVSATNLTTGAGTAAETINKSAISYWSGPYTTISGGGTRIAGQTTAADKVSLSTAVTAFSATKALGTAVTSWAPTLGVTIPPTALVGIYTTVISHSAA
jgi:hypothetical protein